MKTARSLLLLALLLPAGCVTPPRPPELSAEQIKKSHALATGPFWWGTSTSHYQNEDRAARPGDPDYFRTDWDVFTEDEGRAIPRGEEAVFSWTNFDADVAILKEIGVSHFRFGVEWARIEPRPGQYNDRALAQYVQMARKLRAAGIEPIVTLWHFTFPDWLYTTARKPNVNFLHPDMPAAWEKFVTRVVRALKSDVRIFIPQNEPNGAVQLGWLGGHWPPGLLLHPGSYSRANKVAVQSFRVAAKIVKRERPDALIMSVHSLPMWKKNFRQDWTMATYNTMQRQNYDHLDQVFDLCDIIGINYYYSQDATIPRFLFRGHGEMSINYTQMGWKIDPAGLYGIISEVGNRYQKPMVIVENGIGTLNELKRVKYVRDHVNQVRRAMADGYDVRGYFAWTLVDNYEWTEGYEPRFGLSRMDPKTKRRILEPSGKFFREIIQTYGNLRKDFNPTKNNPTAQAGTKPGTNSGTN